MPQLIRRHLQLKPLLLLFFTVLAISIVFDIVLKNSLFPKDTVIIGIGFASFLNAHYNRLKGHYRAKVRIVYESEDPKRFRSQNIMLDITGGIIVIAGAVLQISGLYLSMR